MKSQQPKQTAPWFLFGVFIFFVVGISITGFLVYHLQRNSLKHEAETNLAAIADLKLEQIVQWRYERRGDAEILYNSASLARQVNEYFQFSDKTNREQELLALMKSFRTGLGYKYILLFDSKGALRLFEKGLNPAIDTFARATVAQAIRNREIIFYDKTRTKTNPFLHFDIIVPLVSHYRNDSTVVGAFLLDIDPNTALFQLIQSWPTPSRTAETLLIKRDSSEIIYLNTLRHWKDSLFTVRMPISKEHLPAAIAARGIETTLEGIDYRGVPVFAATRKIQDSPWFMVSKIDQEEVYAPLRWQAWVVGIAMFFLILATGAIIGLWWRHQQTRFYRERYEAQVEHQALVKHFEYLIKYANDIILLVDMDGKIVEANDQACRTYGYTQLDMHSLKIQDIRVPDSFPMTEKLTNKQGEQVGVVFETEHRRKDGTKFPVEISSQIIRIDNTKYLQCIIRNITDRKKAEVALLESEEKHRALVNQSSNAIYVLQNQRLVFVNPAWESIFGYSRNEALAEDFDFLTIVAPESQQIVLDRLRQRDRGEEIPPRYEMRGITKQGVHIDLDVSVSNITWRGSPAIQGIYRDVTDRNRAEEALRESEERYRELYTNATIGIYRTTPHGDILLANPRLLEMLGFSSLEELRARNLEQEGFEPFYSRSNFKQQMERDGEVRGLESAWFRCDGTTIFVRENAKAVRDQDNSIMYYDGMAEDITDRKRAEESLRQSEELFKLLVESSPVAIAVFSGATKNIEYVSRRFTELFGYKQQDIPSMDSWWQHAYPVDEYRNEIETFWNNSSAFTHRDTKDIVAKESEITCKDGSRKYVESTLLSIGELTLVFFSDFTQRRTAEEALRQTHAFNELLIQTMPFGMNIVDEEGNILFINKTMKEMLSLDAVSMCCWTVYKDDKQQCKDCPLKKGISFGKTDILETAGVLNGRTFQISHIGMMYEGRKALLEVFQDITEQKILQQELVQSQKMLSIGTLAGGIAHDFNNILAIILGYITLLSSMNETPQRFSDGVNAIKQAVDRGAALVRQILAFARKTDVAFEPMDVHGLIRELVSMLQQTFPKTITFNKDIEPQLPPINADHTQIHQILLNLCVNARDAMPTGGVITIKAYRAPGDKVRERFPAAVEQRYICISVSDTGIGMDEATRNRIFDPFFTTKEKGKGTGLGLSVVYGVVQSHHGVVDVESAVGNGTTFRLYLPVPKERSVTLGADKSEKLIAGGTETLLVVEDETLLLEMLRILLETHGYTVLTATDGMEAVSVYNQHINEIALVVSDMGLPKLSGEGEFRKLKEINPAIKMVLASGYFEPEIKPKLESAGVIGFLEKPYVIEEVLEIIRKALGEEQIMPATAGK